MESKNKRDPDHHRLLGTQVPRVAPCTSVPSKDVWAVSIPQHSRNRKQRALAVVVVGQRPRR